MYVRADDYDARSRNHECSVTGLPKLPGEEGIFRLAEIEFEGSFDIGEQVVRDMAADLGMVSRDTYDKVLKYDEEMREANDSLHIKLIDAESAYAALELRHSKLLVDMEILEMLIEEDTPILTDEEILGE